MGVLPASWVATPHPLIQEVPQLPPLLGAPCLPAGWQQGSPSPCHLVQGVPSLHCCWGRLARLLVGHMPPSPHHFVQGVPSFHRCWQRPNCLLGGHRGILPLADLHHGCPSFHRCCGRFNRLLGGHRGLPPTTVLHGEQAYILLFMFLVGFPLLALPTTCVFNTLDSTTGDIFLPLSSLLVSISKLQSTL